MLCSRCSFGSDGCFTTGCEVGTLLVPESAGVSFVGVPVDCFVAVCCQVRLGASFCEREGGKPSY